MSVTAKEGIEPQHQLLERWVAALSQLQAVDLIWLEGSLVDGRANPWSDIDLRVALADDAYEGLWDQERGPLLQGLGEHLLLWDKGFVRSVTADGIIVELAARKTSELEEEELYEWKFLFCRLPDGPPTFKKLSERSTAEAWPGDPVTPDDVRQRTFFVLHNLAIVGQDFYNREVFAAAYTLYYLRHELFTVMYQRLGIRVGKRNKELSKIFSPDFLADLAGTYTGEGESALDLAAIAAAQIRTLAALGKHLRALSDQVGGGFEPVWFDRLFEKMKGDLHRLVGGASP